MQCAGTSSPASKPSTSPNLPVCPAHCLLLLPHMALRPVQVSPYEQRTTLGHIQAPHDRTLPSPSPRSRAEHSLQYTYILSLPLITIYSVGNAVIKYQEGFVFDSEAGGEGAPLLLVLLLKHLSVSKAARSMDEGSSRRNLPVDHAVFDWREP